MKKFLFILATLSLVVSLSSCNKDEVKYAVQVDDVAQILSASEIEQLQATDIHAGYQVVIVSADSIDEQNIYKHMRKQYRQIKKQSDSQYCVVIFCFKDKDFITTKLPVSLQNIIDSEYLSQYFKSQKIQKNSSCGKQALQVLGIINNSIAKHEELSGLKKGAVANGIFDIFDFIIRYTIPQDSWVYKAIFSIPLHIALFLGYIVGSSSMWAILLFIAVLLIYQLYTRKLVKKNGVKPIYALHTIALLALKILIVLTIVCLYTTSVPRLELVWTMQEHGISNMLTDSLLNNFSCATTPHFGWLGCVIFCLYMILASAISQPDKFLYAFYKPEIQQKIYRQNREQVKKELNIERVFDSASQGYDDDSMNIDKLDEATKPYTFWLIYRVGKNASSSLLFLIPMCLVLNANFIMIFALYKSVSFCGNILILIDEFTDSRKLGLL